MWHEVSVSLHAPAQHNITVRSMTLIIYFSFVGCHHNHHQSQAHRQPSGNAVLPLTTAFVLCSVSVIMSKQGWLLKTEQIGQQQMGMMRLCVCHQYLNLLCAPLESTGVADGTAAAVAVGDSPGVSSTFLLRPKLVMMLSLLRVLLLKSNHFCQAHRLLHLLDHH